MKNIDRYDQINEQFRTALYPKSGIFDNGLIVFF